MNRRAAMDRLVAFYRTQLGQDVLETALGAATAAGGQALFTDMSAEEIALSTALGAGAAAVGRPLMGRAGQAIGNRIDRANPNTADFMGKVVQNLQDPKGQYGQQGSDFWRMKLAPYANQSPSGQVGNAIGRMYGDNAGQALIALGSPLFLGNDEETPR
jgi:hypothetical protein